MYLIYYSLFLISVVLIELTRTKTYKVDFLTIFNFNFLISYLVPCVLWSADPDGFSHDLPYNLTYNPTATLEVSSALFISYFGFCVSYFTFYRTNLRFYITPIKMYDYKGILRRFIFIMILFVILVFVGIVLMGGLGDFIAAGIESRHTHSSYGLVGYFSYFYNAFPLFFIAIALFVSFKNSMQFSKCYYAIMLIVIGVGMLALLSRGGRTGLVFLLLNVIFYLYMIGKLKFNFKNLLLITFVSLFSLFIISEMHHISAALIYDTELALTEKLELFPSKIGVAILEIFQYSAHRLYIIVEIFSKEELYNYPRLGSDNLSGLLILIPGSLSSNLGLYVLPDYVSQQVMGKYNGDIPPGWIGWALLNGGYLWLLLKTIIAAYFAVVLDKSRSNFIHKIGDIFGQYFYFIIMLTVNSVLFIGTAKNLVRGQLGIAVFFALIFFIPYIRVIKLRICTARI